MQIQFNFSTVSNHRRREMLRDTRYGVLRRIIKENGKEMVNKVDSKKRTALMIAAKEGNIDVVKYLLSMPECDANLQVRIFNCDIDWKIKTVTSWHDFSQSFKGIVCRGSITVTTSAAQVLVWVGNIILLGLIVALSLSEPSPL